MPAAKRRASTPPPSDDRSAEEWVRYTVRLRPAEAARVEKLSEDDGIRPAQWLRQAVLQRLNREG